jgi:hypothetical protein
MAKKCSKAKGKGKGRCWLSIKVCVFDRFFLDTKETVSEEDEEQPAKPQKAKSMDEK